MFKFGKKVNKKLPSLIKLLPKKATVLDLGCGAGANDIFLKELGFSVTCVDKDSEVIKDIKENHPDIKVVEQDITKYDFPPQGYDLILALNILHFFDLQTATTIIKRAMGSLKKEGIIFLEVFSSQDPANNDIRKIAEKTKEKNTFFNKKIQQYMHYFEKEELLALFSKNKILEIEEFSIKDNHPPLGIHGHAIIRIVVRK
jgi:SAM-dependent methyltransferase